MPYRDGAAPFYWWTSDDVLVDVGTPLGIGRSIPRVESAVSQDITHVRVAYDCEMKHANESNVDDSLHAANYEFSTGSGHSLTPKAVVLVQASPTIVDVEINEREMTIGTANYTVTVSNAQSLSGDPVGTYNHADFDGKGARPRVSSATVADTSHIRVSFDETMTDDAQLDDPTNYTLEKPVGAPVLTILDIAVDAGLSFVTLHISGEMRTGTGNYGVTVESLVKDEFLNGIDISFNHVTFDGVGIAPQVTSPATTIDFEHVRVTFSEEVNETQALAEGNYAIGNHLGVPLAVLEVVKNSLTQYTLTTAAQVYLEVYTVAVSTVEDLAGNPIDPAHNEATFEGAGHPPKLLTPASCPDSTHVRIEFDQEMKHSNPAGSDDTTNPANYEFSVTGGVAVLAVSVAVYQTDPTIVDVLFGNEMTNGAEYEVDIDGGVRSILNETMDPTATHAEFDGVGIAPEVNDAVATDGILVEVAFSEDMDNDGELDNPANYDFSTLTGDPILAVDVQVLDFNKVRIQVNQPMTVGATYTVTVSGVRDLAGNLIASPPLNQHDFVGVPSVTMLILAGAQAFNRVRVTFNNGMVRDELLAKGNYGFTSLEGEMVNVSVLEVLLPLDTYPAFADLITNEMTGGKDYRVRVSPAVHDRYGTTLDEDHCEYSFEGIGEFPEVQAVVALSKNRVQVVFTEAMEDNADLHNPAKYSFDKGLLVHDVVEVSSDSVVLRTTDQDPLEPYTLTVVP